MLLSAGLTLASQWKSQFDDSEETDNEWKGENLQSPEHRHTLTSQVCPLPMVVGFATYCPNITSFSRTF
jgi:hypothetical protein